MAQPYICVVACPGPCRCGPRSRPVCSPRPSSRLR